MLDIKKHRLDYGAMLIPPSGYRLAKAVAATYTLDLNTLLSIPVALFFSQTLEGNFETERVQLLEAIQRCPDVLRIYHQKGKIHVPRKHNRLYGLLEPCVVGILPEDAYTAFHPKVWVLRYEHDEEPTMYRVIVLSRNLTYDRSWDIAAHLDGEVTDTRQRKNQPLVSFVQHLLSHEGFDGDRKFVSDLRKVEFQTPIGFNNNFVFHPVGIDGHENPIVTQEGSRAICVSPFLHDEAVHTVWENVSDELLLFGCREELKRLQPETLEDVRAFCISDLIVDGESLETGEDGEGEQLEQNLHAKLYVYQGDSTRTLWFLGSANATKAAFERNIEFILELRGRSGVVQLDRLKEELLGKNEQGGIFQPYEPPDEPIDDSERKKLEEKLRLLEFDLLRYLDIKQAEVTPSENEANFDLHLILDPGSRKWKGFSVRVSPFNSDGIEPRELAPGRLSQLVFENINEGNLSRFLRFEIWQEKEQLRSFLMKVEIDGLPETRVSRILRSIINSRDRFFEYLRFLLADDIDKEQVGTGPDDNGRNGNGEGASIWDLSTPIFEQLLLAASRSPRRLKAIDDVIQQLRKEEGEDAETKIVPQEFVEFWEAFKQVVPTQIAREQK
ncbi:PLD phosphodiesterase domain-containing protein [Planctomycetales bacterium 10988]|nr:PLD phosphodiesterase domain-containing protein [Planctomycetales bacterium 10988]